MAIPNVLVLRAPGINCDEETVFTWRLAGAHAKAVHINELIETPALLDGQQVLTIPGGFSFGDDIASGKVLANRIIQRLGDHLMHFVERGGCVLGICNGFQVLVRTGLVPGADAPARATLGWNESGRYEARWVRLKALTDRSPFLEVGSVYEFPVEHAEGRLLFEDGAAGADRLKAAGRVALEYIARDGDDGPVSFPDNPNGSIKNAAGLIDASGRVLGLMPHPERYIDSAQYRTGPLRNTKNGDLPVADGLRFFQTAVRRLAAEG